MDDGPHKWGLWLGQELWEKFGLYSLTWDGENSKENWYDIADTSLLRETNNNMEAVNQYSCNH